MKLKSSIIGILIARILASKFQQETKVTIFTRKRATERFLHRLLIGILMKSPCEGVGCLKHAHDGKEGDFVHQHSERVQPVAWFRQHPLKASQLQGKRILPLQEWEAELSNISFQAPAAVDGERGIPPRGSGGYV